MFANFNYEHKISLMYPFWMHEAQNYIADLI